MGVMYLSLPGQRLTSLLGVVCVGGETFRGIFDGSCNGIDGELSKTTVRIAISQGLMLPKWRNAQPI